MPPSETAASAASIPLPLTQEDQARADLYALCASLLLTAPDAALLKALGAADSLHVQQEGPLDQAWERLVLAAGLIDADAVREEFDALFISVGTPLVNPYASHYLVGFMHEKPLAALRDELRALGLARVRGVGEPEDHLGALCEVMRILIAGAPDGSSAASSASSSASSFLRRPLETQRTLFLRHVAPWQERCLADIRQAACSSFYRHVADFASAFFEVEFQAFEMEDEPSHEGIESDADAPIELQQ